MRTRDFDKQRRIKDAMIRLILRDGINGASVAKIAQEAGVSPATIYIYYSSKEEMLSAVYQEYSHQSYHFLMRHIEDGMRAADLIEAIVRGYFDYAVEHEEVFSFVEQCSRCPTISEDVSEEECCCEVFDLIHAYQRRGEVKPYSDNNIAAVLFPPVRFIARNRQYLNEKPDEQLSELIKMLQSMLLS